MNSTSSPALKSALKMPPFREALKRSVAGPHTHLEKLPLMQRYASGDASLKEYIHVTRVMQLFWSSYKPAIHNLSIDYTQFLNNYLQALRDDVEPVSLNIQKKSVHEIAFYYVLLGSGLGAKVILKNNLGNDYPKKNLSYLAGNSAFFWKDFTQAHIASVPATDELLVLEESRMLFDDLLNHMLPKTKVSSWN